MAFTPSNLSIANMGSLKLTIAQCNANTVSGTDLWTSGITDIQGVIPVYLGSQPTLAINTSVPLSISWTQSTGTIHIIRALDCSSTGLMLYVFSGFASDMTW
jgi:hypothetical protein